MRIQYDKSSDTLHMDWCDPYAAQDSRSLEPGVLARINPVTQRVENLEFLDFEARFGGREGVELSLIGSLELTLTQAPRPGK